MAITAFPCHVPIDPNLVPAMMREETLNRVPEFHAPRRYAQPVHRSRARGRRNKPSWRWASVFSPDRVRAERRSERRALTPNRPGLAVGAATLVAASAMSRPEARSARRRRDARTVYLP